MKAAACALLLCLAIGSAVAEVYFQEKFDDSWTKRWHKSNWKKSDGSAGEFTLTAGKWYGDAKEDLGIQTGPDSKYYAVYTELKKPVDNTGKTLVLQFSAKHEQDLDCGGGYIKLIPGSAKKEMASFGGDTPYSIMFGPDICGYSTRKVHVILTKDGKNHLIKKDIKCETDQLTHVYTLELNSNNTYKVYIDEKEVADGSLYEDWDILPPKTIKDPTAKKPDAWDDQEMIDDPEDVKPEGHDDIPATLPDPEAKKPEDWDDEDDGEWEAPTIPNPEYKGEWKAKKIANPKYDGVWEAPDIDNPEYKHDDFLYQFKDTKYIGFELWQVKSGSIFDNIFLGTSVDEAFEFANETWGKTKDAEKAMFDKWKAEEDAKKAAEAEAAAEAAKAEKPEAGDEEEEEEEDDYEESSKEEL